MGLGNFTCPQPLEDTEQLLFSTLRFSVAAEHPDQAAHTSDSSLSWALTASEGIFWAKQTAFEEIEYTLTTTATPFKVFKKIHSFNHLFKIHFKSFVTKGHRKGSLSQNLEYFLLKWPCFSVLLQQIPDTTKVRSRCNICCHPEFASIEYLTSYFPCLVPLKKGVFVGIESQ